MGAPTQITTDHVRIDPRICPRTSVRNLSNGATSKHGRIILLMCSIVIHILADSHLLTAPHAGFATIDLVSMVA